MAAFNAEQLTHMYATMVCIRLFEQKTIEVFARRIKAGQTPGALHSSEGHEAIAVGVFSTLLPDDYVFSTYRGHGHAIAQGSTGIGREQIWRQPDQVDMAIGRNYPGGHCLPLSISSAAIMHHAGAAVPAARLRPVRHSRLPGANWRRPPYAGKCVVDCPCVWPRAEFHRTPSRPWRRTAPRPLPPDRQKLCPQ